MSAVAFDIDCVCRASSDGQFTSSRFAGVKCRVVALTAALLVMGAASALALDGSQQPEGQKIPLKPYTSADEALRAGLDDLQAGNAKSSVDALTYAAEGGQVLARWKLGSMYASGEGVPRDDLKAYHYFQELIDNYNEDEPNRRDLGAISKAFVKVGVYILNGIPNSEVKADPERAMEMFQYAATNFGDPDAQYNLARMYMDGAGGLAKNNMRAARWLSLAAEKRHHPAQALLGHLLFVGDGVPQQRGRGLIWLTIAKSAAKGPKDDWIKDLFVKDYNAASDDDRQIASIYISERASAGEAEPPPSNPVSGWLASGRSILPPMPRMLGSAPMSAFAGPDKPQDNTDLATVPQP
jgi:TPR repeat protein